MRAAEAKGKAPSAALRALLAIVLAVGMLPIVSVTAETDAYAADTPISAASWEEVKPEIEKLLGTPYKYGGRPTQNNKVPSTGWDCAGFVSYVMVMHYGTAIPGGSWGEAGTEAIARYVAGSYLAGGSSADAYESLVESGKVKPGDIIIYFNSYGTSTHCAIAGEGTTIYHAYNENNDTCHGEFSEYWNYNNPTKNWVSFKVYRGLASNGRVELVKTSSNPALTEGSSCYSLAGAVYGIYKTKADAEADANRVAELVTDAEGNAKAAEIAAGTYYVREVEPSKGFALDENVYTVTVKGGETAEVTSVEKPLSDPADVLLKKVDADTGEPIPAGSASLALAEYTFAYFDGYYGQDGEEGYEDVSKAGEPERTWTLRTDADGYTAITFAESTFEHEGQEYPYLVSGDALFKDGGIVTLPLGTVVVTETKAPAGYVLSDASYLFRIVADGSGGVGIEGSSFIRDGNSGEASLLVVEQVKRGDIRFEKKDGTGSQRMAGVAFRITSETTGESHVVVTDANGEFNSSAAKNPHTYNTNANDAVADGAYDPDAGTWFGGGEPDDSVGALPYDTYTVEELPCEANEGLQLAHEAGVVVSKHSHVVDLGTIDDPECNIATSARDAADGDRNVSVSAEAVVIDRVWYSGLVPGTKATVSGRLVDKSTGETLVSNGEEVRAEATFTAMRSSGYVELSFSFDATQLAGRELVAFEELSVLGRTVASHEDPDDAEQTVRVVAPRISTTARDAADGDSEVAAEPGGRIVDEVAFEGLVPGTYYTVSGTLVDKETGEPVMSGDEPVTAEVKFAPEASSGTVEVPFDLDATDMAGREAVAFEQLLLGSTVIAEHADIDDPAQTVSFAAPEISTSAADSLDGDKLVVNSTGAEITDTVTYSGLVEGEKYRLEAELYSVELEDAVASGELEFTARASYGQAEVRIPFDATGMAGMDLVVLERLYHGDALVAEHADVLDAGQTVTVAAPALDTVACDAADGDKEIPTSTEAVILDEVTYIGVVKGRTYTLTAAVVDAETGEEVLADGQPVTAQTTFTALDDYGTAEVEIALDASGLEGRTLVVFQTLSEGDSVLAVHADALDADQSVRVIAPEIATFASSPIDGGKTVPADSSAEGILDEVSYDGLVADGGTYTVYGILMDLRTDLPLLTGDAPRAQAEAFIDGFASALGVEIDRYGGWERVGEADAQALADLIAEMPEVASKASIATASFRPVAAWGTVEVSFDIEAEKLAGSAGVVFEFLVRDDSAQTVAVHADMLDSSQMFMVTDAAISTTATDRADGDKNLAPEANGTVRDTVTYTGLVPGTQYRLSATIVDKETGKALPGACADVYFSPNHSAGTVYVDIPIDASELEDGKTLVVFESLYKDGELVAEHADINDQAQSVKVKKPPTGTFIPKLGAEVGPAVPVLVLAAAAVAALVGYAALQIASERRRERAGR